MINATSCGGVVIFRGKILLLYKNIKNKYEGWVLPKGTVEEGEDYNAWCHTSHQLVTYAEWEYPREERCPYPVSHTSEYLTSRAHAVREYLRDNHPNCSTQRDSKASHIGAYADK